MRILINLPTNSFEVVPQLRHGAGQRADDVRSAIDAAQRLYPNWTSMVITITAERGS